MITTTINNNYLLSYEKTSHLGHYGGKEYIVTHKNNLLFKAGSIQLSSGFSSFANEQPVYDFELLYSINGIDFISFNKYLNVSTGTLWDKTFDISTIPKMKVLKIVILRSSVDNFSKILLNNPSYYLVKYLIQDNNSSLFTFNGVNIIQSSSQTLDEDNFKNNGFNDMTAITEEQLNKAFPNKEGIKILMWTDDTEKQEAKMTYECEPFELIDWLKQDECKLLVYTDYLQKKECEMVYNCNPYKPIDKLKETGYTCKVLIKEM